MLTDNYSQVLASTRHLTDALFGSGGRERRMNANETTPHANHAFIPITISYGSACPTLAFGRLPLTHLDSCLRLIRLVSNNSQMLQENRFGLIVQTRLRIWKQVWQLRRLGLLLFEMNELFSGFHYGHQQCYCYGRYLIPIPIYFDPC